MLDEVLFSPMQKQVLLTLEDVICCEKQFIIVPTTLWIPVVNLAYTSFNIFMNFDAMIKILFENGFKGPKGQNLQIFFLSNHIFVLYKATCQKVVKFNLIVNYPWNYLRSMSKYKKSCFETLKLNIPNLTQNSTPTLWCPHISSPFVSFWLKKNRKMLGSDGVRTHAL